MSPEIPGKQSKYRSRDISLLSDPDRLKLYHFARFDVRTGQLLHGPVAENVAVYEVRIDGDMVYVQR